MKTTLKNSKIIRLILVLTIIFCFNANAYAMEDIALIGIETTINEGVMYSYSNKQFETINYVDIDINDLKPGENLIFSNGKYVAEIYIKLPENDIELTAIYDDGWSGGTLPSTA